jgi:peptidoglycan hydrolase-like protein with peptidoglycan-binding domain
MMGMMVHRLGSVLPPKRHGGVRARSKKAAEGGDRAPVRAGQWLGAPLGLQRAALGDLQRLRGNGHVQRLIDRSVPAGIQPGTATATLQRQPGATPTLGPGSRGPAVVALQQQLNAAGAAVGTDGVFGARTRAAVVAFQQGAGLTADGVVGPKTWQSLRGGGKKAPVGAVAGAPPNPQQAVLLAKLGQVRIAMQGLKAGNRTPAGTEATDGKRDVKPVVGKPVPTCGIPIPDGATPINEETPPGQAVVQRSFLDDAESWVEDTAQSASEWVGEKAQAAEEAVGSASSWVEEKVDAAGDWAQSQVASASEWVGEEVDQAAGQVQEIVGAAKETVEGGIDAVVQTAGELAKDVGEFGEDVKKRFADEIAIVQQVIQDLGKPFGDLGGMVKQLDDILSGLTGGGKTNWMGWFGNDEPDDVKSKVYVLLDTKGKVTRGGVKVPGGTGYSQPTFTFDPIKWWRATDDAIVVQATLKTDCHWEIAAEGRGTSIDSANHPAVTEISYLTIINDLEQMSESYKHGGGVVTTFWSEPLIERHEQFHCNDYIGEATNYVPTVQSWLESQEVTHPPGNDGSVEPQVQKLMATARQQVEDDGRKYFDNGGEARAYGDGKASYDALINAIKARAKAEKWK